MVEVAVRAVMTPDQVADFLADELFKMETIGHLRPRRWEATRRDAMRATLRWAVGNFRDGVTAEQAGEQVVKHYNALAEANRRFAQPETQVVLGRWLLLQVPRVQAMLAGVVAADAEAAAPEPKWEQYEAVMVMTRDHQEGLELPVGTVVWIYSVEDHRDRVYVAESLAQARRGDYRGYVHKAALGVVDPEELARREAKQAKKYERLQVGAIADDKQNGGIVRLVLDYDKDGGTPGLAGNYPGYWEVDPIDPTTKRSINVHSHHTRKDSLEIIEDAPPTAWPTIEAMSENDPDDVEGLREALRQARQDHLDDTLRLSDSLAAWAIRKSMCATYDAIMLDTTVGAKVPLAPRNARHTLNLVDRYIVEIPRKVEILAVNVTAAAKAAESQPTRYAPDLSEQIVGRLSRNLVNVREGVKVTRDGAVKAIAVT